MIQLTCNIVNSAVENLVNSGSSPKVSTPMMAQMHITSNRMKQVADIPETDLDIPMKSYCSEG